MAGFGLVVTALVTTQSVEVTAGIGDDRWLVYRPSVFQATQPGHPSVGKCNEYWQRLTNTKRRQKGNFAKCGWLNIV